MKLDLQLAMDREETYTLQSWDTFFQEVEQFVGSLDRHDGFANEAFTEYAIERLEVCIVGVTRLKDMCFNLLFGGYYSPLKSSDY